jgi:hypothetical protein
MVALSCCYFPDNYNNVELFNIGRTVEFGSANVGSNPSKTTKKLKLK